ncbi:MAG: type I restriction enzyme HsdR N-terminal domain-containing protein [Bacteroidetes bacterium]|nr:type I restriction enzyme HsdR N-terminal domain-containing protein [Bacteroidota bacterium]
MLQLNLPEFGCKVSKKEGKLFIFDIIRKKNVVLTPEEWVRQHFINFLMVEKNISPNRISLELPAKYNRLSKRCDIVVWDANLHPLLLVECKAPFVEITHKTLHQISTYNSVIDAPYLALTNGLVHFFLQQGRGEVSLKEVEV